jgi:uncharacterized membrane protein
MDNTTTRPAVTAITEKETSDGKVMSIIAYLGILCFIPLFTSRDNKFVMYHTEQGLALFIAWVIVAIVLSFLDPIRRFINIFINKIVLICSHDSWNHQCCRR